MSSAIDVSEFRLVMTASELLRILKASLIQVSKARDADHPYSHVCFEVSDGWLNVVATDGHRMSVYTRLDPSGAGQCLMPRAFAASMVKMLRALPRKVESQVALNHGTVEGSFGSFAFTPGDSGFVPWRIVMPAEGSETELSGIGINGKYLADAQEAFSLANDSKTTCVTLKFHGPLDPIIVEGFPDGPLHYVLMPARV